MSDLSLGNAQSDLRLASPCGSVSLLARAAEKEFRLSACGLCPSRQLLITGLCSLNMTGGHAVCPLAETPARASVGSCARVNENLGLGSCLYRT